MTEFRFKIEVEREEIRALNHLADKILAKRRGWSYNDSVERQANRNRKESWRLDGILERLR